MTCVSAPRGGIPHCLKARCCLRSGHACGLYRIPKCVMRTQAVYLNSISYFRAIAIIAIVAGHCFDAAGIEFDSFLSRLMSTIVTGSSSLFVFVSGFLFHHIFCQKFAYRPFIRSKFHKILVPYLLLGIVPIIGFVVLHKEGSDGHGGFFPPSGPGFISEHVAPTAPYYWARRFLKA